MDYEVIKVPDFTTNECLVLGLFADTAFDDFTQKMEQQQGGLITRLFSRLKEPGDFIWQSEVNSHSLLLFHCGNKSSFLASDLTTYLNEIISQLLKQRIKSATLCLPLLPKQHANWQIEQMLLHIDAQLYQLIEFKSKDSQLHALDTIHFYLPEACDKAIEYPSKVASAINFTRTLANLPANICTPTYLSEQAKQLARKHKCLKTRILGPKEMKKLGMGALLAVAKGSVEEPCLIEIHYQGGGKAQPIVFVGKGITFDSGGLSLKPANVMDEMKYDMAGAATVLGIMQACADLNLPINIIGIAACAENMPSGTAVKPGDIVTSLSGQTIEIINTDAEGRLVLADAITYAQQFKPRFLIDIATLTGAMVIALGSIMTGFMSKDEELASLLSQASEQSQDKLWRMPLDKAYQTELASPLADMINANFDRSAGAIIAASFLARFTENCRWAHLDIAGTAWISGKKRQATGRPLPLLMQFLRHVSNSR